MRRRLAAPILVLVLVGLFVWAGEIVTRASGQGTRPLAEGVGADRGEEVFWGRGKCSTCHALGGRGGSVRGPNLGASEQGPPIGVRAEERARERAGQGADVRRAVDYVTESIADPGAYVVTGFKNEMPRVWEPPISLSADDIVSVVLYLLAQGGAVDATAVELPAEILQAVARGAEDDGWAPYLEGDSLRGRALFFDLEGPAACGRCHTVHGEGGAVGPELTAVAGTRPARFIVESILEPSAEIAGGYETELIQTTSGRILDGVVQRETGDSLWLAGADGRVTPLSLAEVARRRLQEVSLMPGDLAELLTVAELHDVLAFLGTLR